MDRAAGDRGPCGHMHVDRAHAGRFPIQRGDDYIYKAGEICGHNIIITTLPAG
ncbi:hypothetical protein MY10362_006897 [Beauveria mimosiformis]